MLLIDAIAQVESGNRPVVGDNGAAISAWQIHRAVWQDVHVRWGNPDRVAEGKVYLDVGEKWEDIGGDDELSRTRARNCARGQVSIISEFLNRHNITASADNIYACWNLGCEGFRRRQFSLAHCPEITIRAASQVEFLSDHKPKPPIQPKRTQRAQKQI